MKYETILFDLDGTISDTSAGIIFCLKETFKEFGADINKYNLFDFIGPPLSSTCELIAGDGNNPEEVLAFFRNLYKDHIYDNVLYEGIVDLFASLKQKGYFLGVATSKYQPMAVKVLDRLGVLKYFDFVYGALENRGEKHQVLQAIFDDQKANKSTTVLVGDTFYDMRGAQTVGIDAIGVTYGFGKKEDLIPYNPVKICENTKQIKDYLID
ncbi:MAG: HAD-IA family hydrolase [Clostridia bacterium]|nr:HAD-IA family hydrolase [Clostridia bacterium]